MNRQWEWIILSVRSLAVFEENIVETVLAKLFSLFSNVLTHFFVTRSLIDRCQIVTDRSLLNHLYRDGNENVSLRHLSWICITSILTTIHSLKNCSVHGRSCRIYSPKSFGFFRKELRRIKKKKNVIYRLRVGPYGEKLWPCSWKC